MSKDIKTWRERVTTGYEGCDERDARDEEIAELRAALAQRAASAPEWRGIASGFGAPVVTVSVEQALSFGASASFDAAAKDGDHINCMPAASVPAAEAQQGEPVAGQEPWKWAVIWYGDPNCKTDERYEVLPYRYQAEKTAELRKAQGFHGSEVRPVFAAPVPAASVQDVAAREYQRGFEAGKAYADIGTPDAGSDSALAEAAKSMVAAFNDPHTSLAGVARWVNEVSEILATPAVASGALPELPEPLDIDWPTLNSNALGCGVEDRGLHDRYECAEYGWQDGVDMAASCVPDAIYDADQMRKYGDARAAAAAPNAALVEALEALEDVGALEDGLLGDDSKVIKAQKMARAALAQAGAA